MKWVGWLLLCFVLLAGCEGDQTPAPGRAFSGFSPSHPFTAEEWKSEVLESREPVLVDFWATWCGPCRKMEPVLANLARDYKVRQVDVDTNAQLKAYYGIGSIPALLIFKNGKVVKEFIGTTPEEALRAALRKYAGR